MDMQTLPHINVPVAQTWNYLHINDVTFEVPQAHATGKVYEAVPRVFKTIETGAGARADEWIVDTAGDGRYVEVPRNSVRQEPIVISVGATEAANTAIMLRAGSKATVAIVAADTKAADEDAQPATSTEQPATFAEQPATSAALTRIYLERGAKLNLTELVAASGQHIESVGIYADDEAEVSVAQYALSGKKTAFGFACHLAGDASRLDLTMRYYVDHNNLLDVNQLCRMSGQHSRSEIHANGVLADAGHKTLRQTIDLVHGAKDAKGNESETVLVTGDDCINKTLPTVLCDEDDVQGNHGATIGSVSPDQFDYLAARGLSRTQAEALFVRAIFDDAILHAPSDTLRLAATAQAEVVLGTDIARELDESREA